MFSLKQNLKLNFHFKSIIKTTLDITKIRHIMLSTKYWLGGLNSPFILKEKMVNKQIFVYVELRASLNI